MFMVGCSFINIFKPSIVSSRFLSESTPTYKRWTSFRIRRFIIIELAPNGKIYVFFFKHRNFRSPSDITLWLLKKKLSKNSTFATFYIKNAPKRQKNNRTRTIRLCLAPCVWLQLMPWQALLMLFTGYISGTRHVCQADIHAETRLWWQWRDNSCRLSCRSDNPYPGALGLGQLVPAFRH